ncbi:hypothetical protein ATL40_2594 [Serinibacter salmoneus]|uniref:LppM domain-containing protein n=1 Tax=Serinibacter salmoneus TaxID=556530 RepID=A0A2A9D3Z5_9MICO|nr:hypothetical protein ATL40_2594 [Serinibacter salmoneus]
MVAIALMGLLTGCMKFTTDLTIDADLNVSGEIVFGIETQALETMGATPEDVVGEAPEDLPEGATYEPLDDGTYSGFVFGLEGVSASEFTSGEGVSEAAPGLSISEQDGVITFAMDSPLAELEEESAGSEMPFDATSMVDEAWVQITFPGPVTEAEGAEISGNTARWDLTEYSAAELTATAESGDAGGLWLTLALIIVVVLLAVAVVAVIIRRRGAARRQGTSGPTSTP